MPIDLYAFQSPNKERNEDKVRGDDWPCLICGKPISAAKLDSVQWGELTNGGAQLLTSDDPPADQMDAGWMGFHPIGPDCYRRIKRTFKVTLDRPEQQHSKPDERTFER